MISIKDAISLKKDIIFDGAVQTDWYYDEEKAYSVSENFVFHGPSSFAVTSEDVTFKSHKLMDTCSYAQMISERLYGEEDGNSIILTIAGYGTGKSHLAVTLASLFSSKRDSKLRNKIINNISYADNKIAREIDAQIEKPNLVIVLNGMNDFNLNYEILSKSKEELLRYGYGEEIFSEYTRAYNLAQVFAERNYENFEKEFKELAKKKKIDFKGNLKEYIISNVYKDSIFDLINEVYFISNGSYIRWDDGVSSSDVLEGIVDKMCGDNGPFNKVLILFDEFGRYIEYASEYPNRAGDAALQQIFEAIQNSDNKIIFNGFIQSDLKTYLSRVNKISNISRYIGRYESGQKIYLSSNLETIFANLIGHKDESLFEKYILSNMRKKEVLENSNKLYRNIKKWIPMVKDRGVWSNKEKYASIILKGIYPFNPITTWMLNYLSDWYQQRSAINFLIEAFDSIKDKKVSDFGDLPEVRPIDIIKSQFFEELLLAESEGRQKSKNCILYNNILSKYGEKLSDEEKDILAGILILKLGKFKNDTKEDVKEAIEATTGLKNNIIDKSLKSLEDNFGVIEYDEKLNSYDFIEDATGVNDFRRFIKGKRSSIINNDIEYLINHDIEEKIGIGANQKTDFAARNNIKTNEWEFTKKFVTIKNIDDVFVNNIIKDFEKSTEPNKAKGKLLYIYYNSTYDLETLDRAKDIFKRYNISEYPFVWILLDDKENELYNNILDMNIIPKITREEKMKFARFIPNFENKVEEQLELSFEKLEKERLIFTDNGIEASKKRISMLLNEKFKMLYKNIISFPFDGFDRKNLSKVKNMLYQICKMIISGSMNYQQLEIQNREFHNRVDAILKNKFVGWGVLNDDYEVVYPENPKVRKLFEEVDEELYENEEIGLYSIYQKYSSIPYGLNDYSIILIMSIYIYLKKLECKIFNEKSAVKNIDWANEFYDEKKFNILKLKEYKIKKVDIDEYMSKYNRLCELIEKNRDISKFLELNKKLEEVESEEDVPDELKYRFDIAKRTVKEGCKIFEDTENEIAKYSYDIDEIYKKRDLDKATNLIKKINNKSSIIEHNKNNAGYIYTDIQIEKLDYIKNKAYKIIESDFEYFLKNNVKCHGVQNISKFDSWTKGMAKRLEELGYMDYSRKLRTKSEKELDDISRIRKRQNMADDIKKYKENARVNAETSQERLNEIIHEGEGYLKEIDSNQYLDNDDKEGFKKAIELKIESARKELKYIEDKIMYIIDIALEVKTQKDAIDILRDIRILLDRKLKEVDRKEIQEIGDTIQNLSNDLDSINIIDDYYYKIEKIKSIGEKYSEYDGETLNVKDIINNAINDILLKINTLNREWKQMYLMYSNEELSKWSDEECFTWLNRTKEIPYYIKDDVKEEYYSIKEKVNDIISKKKIKRIQNIFKDLSDIDKQNCIDILKSML